MACMLGTLFFMATAGSAYLQWLLAALLGGYASLHVISFVEDAGDPSQRAVSSRPRRSFAT